MSEPVVLGIESTCDETAAAIVRGRELRGDQVVPIEPLYLRRPDAEVPNPLKHVLGHAGADKA